MLYSTLVEIEVEVGVELGNYHHRKQVFASALITSDLLRHHNFQDVQTETQQYSRILGCQDQDSLRPNNLKDVETETQQTKKIVRMSRLSRCKTDQGNSQMTIIP